MVNTDAEVFRRVPVSSVMLFCRNWCCVFKRSKIHKLSARFCQSRFLWKRPSMLLPLFRTKKVGNGHPGQRKWPDREERGGLGQGGGGRGARASSGGAFQGGVGGSCCLSTSSELKIHSRRVVFVLSDKLINAYDIVDIQFL